MDKDTLHLAEKILYTIGIVTGFWKFVDGFFSYLHKRQKGFITDLIKEELQIELRSLREDVQEMKEEREKDNRYINTQLQTILQELRK